MNDIIINTAGVLYALWRAAVLWAVWRKCIPAEKTQDTSCNVARLSSLTSDRQKGVFVITAVTGIVFHFVTLPVRGGFLLVNGALLLAFCAWRRRVYLQEAVFVILLVYSLQALFVLVMSGLGEVLAPLVFRSVLGGIADEATVEREAAIYSALFHLTGGALLGIQTFFACKIIGHPPKQTWTDTAYLSVLNVIGIIISFVMTDIAVVPLETDVFILTTERRALIWVLPLIAVLIYAGELVVLYAWKRYRETIVREQQLFIEAKEKQSLERRLHEIEAYQDGIRRVRHDMKNHLTNIKGLAAAGNLEELDDYILKLDETVSAQDISVHTGNPVTDIIITEKKAMMEQKDIRFDCGFAMEDESFIPVYDLGIVLGNLLDNAIEACEKVEIATRYIRLEQKHKGNFMLLTVENSFDGNLLFHADGKLKSTKTRDSLSFSENPDHGYGLKNVEEIAKRHLGGVTYHHENGVFRVTVMLQKR